MEISTSENHLKVFIGKFGGREEGFLKEITNAFVFVIHGIFKINNCGSIIIYTGLRVEQVFPNCSRSPINRLETCSTFNPVQIVVESQLFNRVSNWFISTKY